MILVWISRNETNRSSFFFFLGKILFLYLLVLLLLVHQDKWRNLSPSYCGKSSKENPSPKIKSIVPASAVNIQSSAPAASIRRNAASDADMDGRSNCILDGKNAAGCETAYDLVGFIVVCLFMWIFIVFRF